MDYIMDTVTTLRASLFELTRRELDEERAREAAGKRSCPDYIEFLERNLELIQRATTIEELASAPWVGATAAKGVDPDRYGDDIPNLTPRGWHHAGE